VIVPVGGVSKLIYEALVAAKSLGDDVVAVTVQYGDDPVSAVREDWLRWDPGVRLVVLPSPQRNLAAPIVAFVNGEAADTSRRVAVLIPEVEPQRRRHQLLQNQRGVLLATVLRSRTDAVICTMPFRIHE
jgi:hypothetical protein